MEQVIADDDAVLPGYEVLTPAGWKTVCRVGKTTDTYVYTFEGGGLFMTGFGCSVSIKRPRMAHHSSGAEHG